MLGDAGLEGLGSYRSCARYASMVSFLNSLPVSLAPQASCPCCAGPSLRKENVQRHRTVVCPKQNLKTQNQKKIGL